MLRSCIICERSDRSCQDIRKDYRTVHSNIFRIILLLLTVFNFSCPFTLVIFLPFPYLFPQPTCFLHQSFFEHPTLQYATNGQVQASLQFEHRSMQLDNYHLFPTLFRFCLLKLIFFCFYHKNLLSSRSNQTFVHFYTPPDLSLFTWRAQESHLSDWTAVFWAKKEAYDRLEARPSDRVFRTSDQCSPCSCPQNIQSERY